MAFATPPNPRPWGRLLALAITLPLAGSFQPARSATVLSYISSPYSWVGAGESVSVGLDEGFQFTPYRLSSNSVSFHINDFESNPDPGSSRWWILDFATPTDQALSAGTYGDAIRFPLQDISAPGFDFYGNGRGTGDSTTVFSVLEANYAEDGTVQSFAADFLQYEYGDPNTWNKGSIRFNSDQPISLTPEPISDILEIYPPKDTWINPDPEVSDSIDEPVDTPIAIDISLIKFTDFEAWASYWENENYEMANSEEVFYMPIAYSMRSNDRSLGGPAQTPGPLPLAGAFVGWRSARRLRRRRKEGLTQDQRASLR